MKKTPLAALALVLSSAIGSAAMADTVKIGLNYDKTGPYAAQGLDQFQAATLAVEEINAAGGILGSKVELVATDAQANAALSSQNAQDLIEKHGVKMIFGGAASSVAIAVGKVANEKKIPFFGTLTYSTETTGEEGRKFSFRECYDSYAGAKVLEPYIRKNLTRKKFFYITARYTWGYTTEKQIRKISGTESVEQHGRVYTPFPKATEKDFEDAIVKAKASNADVLVLVLFGTDMIHGMKQALAQGLKSKMRIVVPNLTLGMVEGAGPEAMEDVVGALPWSWRVPAKVKSEKGKRFVDKFAAKYRRYPDASGASAYTIMHEYKAAVERAGSFDGAKIVSALENHEYTLLKDQQKWRDFDHQSIQTVFAVKCKKAADVKKDRFQQDYFEIINSMPGEEAFITRTEWENVRKAANKPTHLE